MFWLVVNTFCFIGSVRDNLWMLANHLCWQIVVSAVSAKSFVILFFFLLENEINFLNFDQLTYVGRWSEHWAAWTKKKINFWTVLNAERWTNRLMNIMLFVTDLRCQSTYWDLLSKLCKNMSSHFGYYDFEVHRFQKDQ